MFPFIVGGLIGLLVAGTRVRKKVKLYEERPKEQLAKREIADQVVIMNETIF